MGREGIVALRALALTSKSTLPMCRRHLFSSVVLVAAFEDMTERLDAVLQANPEIASYVKTFIYSMERFDASEHEQRILQVLGRAPTSVMQFIVLHGSPVDWGMLSETTQNGIIRLLQIPTVSRLHLQYLHKLPTFILAFCRNLRHLGIRGVTGTDVVPPRYIGQLSQLTPSEIPHIIKLEEAQHFHHFLELMLQPSDMIAGGPNVQLEKLQEFGLGIHRGRGLNICYDVLKATRELRCFELGLNGYFSLQDLGAILRGSAQTLEGATFHILLDGPDKNPLCGLDSTLKAIAGNNCLKNLTINLSAESGRGCDTESGSFGSLDAVLTEAGAFPALRYVEVTLVWYAEVGEDAEQWIKKLTCDSFPRLLESTTIEICVFEDVKFI
ncbi:hypothetical protein CPC08DRAFT_709047 [Agrocybe pediades]|nr:hypothetical protein CPC08DRAFT_709047 [Agrocybe pediades]